MATHKHDQDRDPLEQLGYESRDVVSRTLSWSLIGFFAFIGLCALATTIIYVSMVPKEMLSGKVAERRILPQPPTPLVQTDRTAVEDIKAVRRREIATLSSYGWVDRSRGIARIPIERAMELTAQRLNAASGPATAERSGLSSPTWPSAIPLTGGTR